SAPRCPHDGEERGAADCGKRETCVRRRRGTRRWRGRQRGRADGNRRREHLMAVAHTAGTLAAPAPRPWWRGRTGLLLAIAAGMVIAYFGWRNEVMWPAALTWNSLAHHLDSFQTWLSNNRNVPHPSVFFRAFNALATFLDNLVGWLSSLF